MLNLFWPRPRRADVDGVGALGRVIHWLCVIAALLCALMALEFAVEGWARSLSGALALTALGLALGSRGLLYVLARE